MNRKLEKDIIQWDVKSWSKALNFWEKEVDWSKIGNGLELGGRQGGLSLWLALKGKKVICSDLKNVEETAKPLHVKYGVTSQIEYQNIDATDIPYENHFDVIVFKSVIGSVGYFGNYANQQKAFEQIYKALKPGGVLLFAENLVGSPLHRKLRKKFIRWGVSWRYITLDEMDGFLSEFSSRKIKVTGVMAAFGRSEGQRRLMATLDGLGLNALCPRKWKYITYGIAVK